MPSKRAVGTAGERLARKILEELGYQIVEANYCRRGGEIDLVAEEGGDIVFVEVKCRTGTEYGTGLESITRVKQVRLARTAAAYLRERDLGGARCRFDALEIQLDPFGEVLRHDLVKGAFVP